MYFCKHHKKSASLTIELSLLMPGIVAILIIIIFTGYYFHDKCIIENAMYTSVFRASNESSLLMNISDVEYNVIDIFENEISGRIIGQWNIEKTVSATSDEIKILVYGNMDVLGGIIPTYLSRWAYTINSERTSLITNGPAYITRDIY